MGNIVEARDLVKRYGNITAVNGLSLKIREGEVYSILGPNGAGKTTTIEMLEGIRRQDSGTITIMGLDPWKDASRLHRSAGIIPQNFNFIPKVTPKEAIRYYSSLFGISDRSEELLQLVGLREVKDVYFQNLSGGQKQKVGLCLALINNPPLLFLDEPTTGLDPQARRNMWDVIRKLKSEGRSILLTTHYLEEAEVLADRVGIVDHGRLIAEGSPEELIEKYGIGKKLVVSGNASVADLVRRETGLSPVLEDGTLAIEIENNEEIVRVLNVIASSGVRLETLALKSDTLEDVFIKMVGKELAEQ